MNILAIGAHPDDIEYGCGGTLIKYAQRGDNVSLLVMTNGALGTKPDIRREEQKEAARLLSAKEVFWGGFQDTELPLGKEIISFVEKIIARVSPEEVYVNYFDDTHQDHRILAHCVISATRYIKKVLFYEDYTTCNFEPNIFVDIKDVLEKKINLLQAHHSQVVKSYPTNLDIIESARAIANFRGFQGKVKYAEGFKTLRFLKEI